MNIPDEIVENIRQIDIPGRERRTWIAFYNGGWAICTTFGPTWFWNDEVGDWVISLDSKNKPTKYLSMEATYFKAKALPELAPKEPNVTSPTL